jgi:hypothetical protein
LIVSVPVELIVGIAVELIVRAVVVEAYVNQKALYLNET